MWEINFFHHFIGLLPSYNIPLFGCSYQQHPCLVININQGSSLALWWRKTTDIVWNVWLPTEWKEALKSHKFYVLRSSLKFSDMFVILSCQDCSSDVLNSWQYPELFFGTGKFKNKYVQIHVDETFKPSAQRSRQKLNSKLLDDDIIKRV